METAAEAAAAVTAVAAFELDRRAWLLRDPLLWLTQPSALRGGLCRQQLLIGNMISSGSSSVVYVGKFAGQVRSLAALARAGTWPFLARAKASWQQAGNALHGGGAVPPAGTVPLCAHALAGARQQRAGGFRRLV